MGKIVILDENTANKIAAGEVVERPSSVVKELVENSIDAGADTITVDIKNGGISFIKVTDNGSGMDDDDVEIAFERHSTSKIRNSGDLEVINTLGFRGEALASIAAVSNVELVTRVRKNPHGMRINIKGGSLQEVKQTGCPAGTTFVISELFFNTPARFKFLKRDATEAGYVSDILNRIALGNPRISLKFTSNGTQLLHTPGNNDLLSTIFSIYGRETAKNVIGIKHDDGRLKLTGYAGKPEIARSNRNYQSFYINGRYIKSRLLSSAVEEAFNTLLMKGKHAFIVLNIELNPLLVDVNVHPTKAEVRFSQEQEIFKAVFHAVRSAMLNSALIRDVKLDRPQEDFKFTRRASAYEFRQDTFIDERNTGVKKEVKNDPVFTYSEEKESYTANNKTQETNDPGSDKYTRETYKTKGCISNNKIENRYLSQEKLPAGKPHAEQGTKAVYTEKAAERTEDIAITQQAEEEAAASKDFSLEMGPVSLIRDPQSSMYHNEHDEDKLNSSDDFRGITGRETDRFYNNPEQKEEVKADLSVSIMKAGDNGLQATAGTAEQADATCRAGQKADITSELASARYIGQAFSTYILLQCNEDLILIDQHAAHERIIYEKLMEKYRNSETMAQYLLAPSVIELTHQEQKLAEEYQEFYSGLGFIFENFGNNSIIIRAVPVNIERESVKDTFLAILDELSGPDTKDMMVKADGILYTMACKAAIKANKKLDELEVQTILNELSRLTNPYSCPHGRPTAIKLSKYELEKRFKRII